MSNMFTGSKLNIDNKQLKKYFKCLNNNKNNKNNNFKIQ